MALSTKRVSLRTIKAAEIPVDVFLFLPDEDRFMYVDDVDHEDDITTVYSENGFNENGLSESTLTFDPDEEVYVVDDYTVTPDTLFEN